MTELLNDRSPEGELSRIHCTACRPDAPRVKGHELEALLAEIPGWELSEGDDGIPHLLRRYDFSDFAEALAFTNRVGALAESEQHHPAITTEWGRVTVSWWTHAIGGLHRNDFIMAAKTDAAV